MNHQSVVKRVRVRSRGDGSETSKREGSLEGQGRAQVQQAGDHPRPSRLMVGPEPGAVVAVEVLVEQEMVAPVRVLLELPRPAVDRTQPSRSLRSRFL